VDRCVPASRTATGFRHTYFNTVAEGADFIRSHIIRVTDRAFDDFASTQNGVALNRLAFV